MNGNRIFNMTSVKHVTERKFKGVRYEVTRIMLQYQISQLYIYPC